MSTLKRQAERAEPQQAARVLNPGLVAQYRAIGPAAILAAVLAAKTRKPLIGAPKSA